MRDDAGARRLVRTQSVGTSLILRPLSLIPHPLSLILLGSVTRAWYTAGDSPAVLQKEFLACKVIAVGFVCGSFLAD
jgi:hypothetical protein